jgi:hypothetical protein
MPIDAESQRAEGLILHENARTEVVGHKSNVHKLSSFWLSVKVQNYGQEWKDDVYRHQNFCTNQCPIELRATAKRLKYFAPSGSRAAR